MTQRRLQTDTEPPRTDSLHRRRPLPIEFQHLQYDTSFNSLVTEAEHLASLLSSIRTQYGHIQSNPAMSSDADSLQLEQRILGLLSKVRQYRGRAAPHQSSTLLSSSQPQLVAPADSNPVVARVESAAKSRQLHPLQDEATAHFVRPDGYLSMYLHDDGSIDWDSVVGAHPPRPLLSSEKLVSDCQHFSAEPESTAPRGLDIAAINSSSAGLPSKWSFDLQSPEELQISPLARSPLSAGALRSPTAATAKTSTPGTLSKQDSSRSKRTNSSRRGTAARAAEPQQILIPTVYGVETYSSSNLRRQVEQRVQDNVNRFFESFADVEPTSAPSLQRSQSLSHPQSSFENDSGDVAAGSHPGKEALDPSTARLLQRTRTMANVPPRRTAQLPHMSRTRSQEKTDGLAGSHHAGSSVVDGPSTMARSQGQGRGPSIKPTSVHHAEALRSPLADNSPDDSLDDSHDDSLDDSADRHHVESEIQDLAATLSRSQIPVKSGDDSDAPTERPDWPRPELSQAPANSRVSPVLVSQSADQRVPGVVESVTNSGALFADKTIQEDSPAEASTLYRDRGRGERLIQSFLSTSKSSEDLWKSFSVIGDSPSSPFASPGRNTLIAPSELRFSGKDSQIIDGILLSYGGSERASTFDAQTGARDSVPTMAALIGSTAFRSVSPQPPVVLDHIPSTGIKDQDVPAPSVEQTTASVGGAQHMAREDYSSIARSRNEQVDAEHSARPSSDPSTAVAPQRHQGPELEDSQVSSSPTPVDAACQPPSSPQRQQQQQRSEEQLDGPQPPKSPPKSAQAISADKPALSAALISPAAAPTEMGKQSTPTVSSSDLTSTSQKAAKVLEGLSRSRVPGSLWRSDSTKSSSSKPKSKTIAAPRETTRLLSADLSTSKTVLPAPFVQPALSSTGRLSPAPSLTVTGATDPGAQALVQETPVQAKPAHSVAQTAVRSSEPVPTSPQPSTLSNQANAISDLLNRPTSLLPVQRSAAPQIATPNASGGAVADQGYALAATLVSTFTTALSTQPPQQQQQGQQPISAFGSPTPSFDINNTNSIVLLDPPQISDLQKLESGPDLPSPHTLKRDRSVLRRSRSMGALWLASEWTRQNTFLSSSDDIEATVGASGHSKKRRSGLPLPTGVHSRTVRGDDIFGRTGAASTNEMSAVPQPLAEMDRNTLANVTHSASIEDPGLSLAWAHAALARLDSQSDIRSGRITESTLPMERSPGSETYIHTRPLAQVVEGRGATFKGSRANDQRVVAHQATTSRSEELWDWDQSLINGSMAESSERDERPSWSYDAPGQAQAKRLDLLPAPNGGAVGLVSPQAAAPTSVTPLSSTKSFLKRMLSRSRREANANGSESAPDGQTLSRARTANSSRSPAPIQASSSKPSNPMEAYRPIQLSETVPIVPSTWHFRDDVTYPRPMKVMPPLAQSEAERPQHGTIKQDKPAYGSYKSSLLRSNSVDSIKKPQSKPFLSWLTWGNAVDGNSSRASRWNSSRAPVVKVVSETTWTAPLSAETASPAAWGMPELAGAIMDGTATRIMNVGAQLMGTGASAHEPPTAQSMDPPSMAPSESTNNVLGYNDPQPMARRPMRTDSKKHFQTNKRVSTIKAQRRHSRIVVNRRRSPTSSLVKEGRRRSRQSQSHGQRLRSRPSDKQLRGPRSRVSHTASKAMMEEVMDDLVDGVIDDEDRKYMAHMSTSSLSKDSMLLSRELEMQLTGQNRDILDVDEGEYSPVPLTRTPSEWQTIQRRFFSEPAYSEPARSAEDLHGYGHGHGFHPRSSEQWDRECERMMSGKRGNKTERRLRKWTSLWGRKHR